MKTIAQQLNIKEFPFEIRDKNNNIIYLEYSDGDWEKYEYDKNNNRIYYENSKGFWSKREYEDNNEVYSENSKGFWEKREYDKNNNEVYFENSKGKIIDNRPKKETEMTKKEAEKKFNIKIK